MKKRTKRIFQIVLIIIELILIAYLFFKSNPEYLFVQPKYIQIPPLVPEKKIKIPSMKIKEATNRKAVGIITDENEEKLAFGIDFTLEQKTNNEWIAMKDKNNIICGQGWHTQMGYIVGEDNTLEMTYSWEEQCGEMPPGMYRVCTDYSQNYKQKYMCAEFEIEHAN